jgi:hypothetical protein
MYHLAAQYPKNRLQIKVANGAFADEAPRLQMSMQMRRLC